METFLLCPGQGAQSIGMGRVWSESNTTVRDTLSEADSILGDQLGQPLTTLCFEGPAESLNQTNVAQPALFAVGVAVWRALAEQGHQLSGAAGLSLGEYTALVAAGAMDFADGLRVVAERGRLMQDAAVARAGGMVAVIGAEDDVVAQLASDAAQGGVLSCANFNAPGQVVIAGDSGRATERKLWRPSVECAARGSRWPVLFIPSTWPQRPRGWPRSLRVWICGHPAFPCGPMSPPSRIRRIPAPFVRIWSLS